MHSSIVWRNGEITLKPDNKVIFTRTSYMKFKIDKDKDKHKDTLLISEQFELYNSNGKTFYKLYRVITKQKAF